jgi:putative hydrolase of the HAD superfamily
VRVRAVLLDVLGTMLELELPWPHLVGELGARGVTISERDAQRAMLAEITYYRANQEQGATQEGLARLRRACAQIVVDELGPAVAALAIEDVEAAMLGALRFAPYPDVEDALAALADLGLTLVAVSDWDISLHGVLDELGFGARLAGVVTSAEVGASKPDAAVFRAGLAVAGVEAGDAVHVGDSVEADIRGALGAGIRAILIDRTGDGLRSHGAGAAAPEGVPTIDALASLPALLR